MLEHAASIPPDQRQTQTARPPPADVMQQLLGAAANLQSQPTQRQRLQAQVFRPTVALPTVSVEQQVSPWVTTSFSLTGMSCFCGAVANIWQLACLCTNKSLCHGCLLLCLPVLSLAACACSPYEQYVVGIHLLILACEGVMVLQVVLFSMLQNATQVAATKVA